MAKGYVGLVGVSALAASVVALFAMAAFSPEALGPFGVTVWFLAVFVALSGWSALAAYRIERRLAPDHRSDKLLIWNSWRRGVMAGGFISVLLALSSLQQLNARDAILLALLILLVEFYTVARS